MILQLKKGAIDVHPSNLYFVNYIYIFDFNEII